MPTVPKKVADRMIEGFKKFQPILAAAPDRDVNKVRTVGHTCKGNAHVK